MVHHDVLTVYDKWETQRHFEPGCRSDGHVRFVGDNDDKTTPAQVGCRVADANGSGNSHSYQRQDLVLGPARQMDMNDN